MAPGNVCFMLTDPTTRRHPTGSAPMGLPANDELKIDIGTHADFLKAERCKEAAWQEDQEGRLLERSEAERTSQVDRERVDYLQDKLAAFADLR